MQYLSLLALVGAATAQGLSKGFNYGNVFTNGSPKQQADFEAEFNRAKALPNASGFSSARLYTMIQGGTQKTPISAIQAAIDTQTSLLLGLWASSSSDVFQNELDALRAAIEQYDTAFTDLIVGISVGSEDLYRISVQGILNESGLGEGPDVLVDYIQRTRSVIAGTAASSATVGHVDTWNDWVNGSNSAVIEAVDWIGFNGKIEESETDMASTNKPQLSPTLKTHSTTRSTMESPSSCPPSTTLKPSRRTSRSGSPRLAGPSLARLKTRLWLRSITPRLTGTSLAASCSINTMSGGTFSVTTMARLRLTPRSVLLVLTLGSRCLILLALLARQALRRLLPSLLLLSLPLLSLPLLSLLLLSLPLLSLPLLQRVTLRRLPTRLLMLPMMRKRRMIAIEGQKPTPSTG
jgi:hypothetical protein